MKIFVAELIGTFALCFIGAGSICVNQMTGGAVGLAGIALAHGLILSVMISALGQVSGGHFNPAVTFGLWVGGKLEAAKIPLYWAAQLVGALLAGVILRYSFKPEVWQAVHLGTPALMEGIPFWCAVAVEAILTFFLVLSVYGTAVDPRHPNIGGFGIGLTVAADILMGGPLTGAAMNPARTFGPGLAAGYFDGHLVYWIGPLLGGAVAGFVYGRLLMKEN